MANRYWVPGGDGNWSSTSNWSTTSGGLGGASVPTANDDVFFDVNSGIGDYTVTINASGQTCRNFTCSAPALGNMTFTGSFGFTVRGSMSLYNGMVWALNATLIFASNTAAQLSVYTAGVTFNNNVSFNPSDSGAVYNLTSALSTTGVVYLVAGTLNTNGYSLTASRLTADGTSARTLNISSSTITCLGAGAGTFAPFNTSGSNITVNALFSEIIFTASSTSVKEFNSVGGDYWSFTDNSSGTGPVHILGNNNFYGYFTIPASRTVKFTVGTTTGLAYPVLTGAPGNMVTLTSITGATHTLSKLSPHPSGPNPGAILSFDYMNISYSIANETDTWYAGSNSIDGGNNMNWVFAPPPSTSPYTSVDGVLSANISRYNDVVWSNIATIK